jgi:hypothetical protein
MHRGDHWVLSPIQRDEVVHAALEMRDCIMMKRRIVHGLVGAQEDTGVGVWSCDVWM